MNLFLEESFREYTKERYFVEDPAILTNPAIMQMIYALEWYDVPRSAYSDLIEYHPYLTRGDHAKLFYVNTQHRIENCVSFLLFSLVSNRLLINRGSIFKKRWVRAPAALGLGTALTYFFNVFVLRPIYLNDIGELGLSEKYFYLDLNADLMKEDLKQYGFKIDAKHFDLDDTERRA
jgi:hypothetical protein